MLNEINHTSEVSRLAVEAYLAGKLQKRIESIGLGLSEIEPVKWWSAPYVMFDPVLWSENTAVDEYVKDIVHILCRDDISTRSKNCNNLYATTKIILLNLVRTYIAGPDHYLTVSLNKNHIDIPKRYRKSGLNYNHYKIIIDSLRSNGQIEFHRGFCDRSKYASTPYSNSKVTRIKAQNTLLEIIKNISPEYLMRFPREELIELKGGGEGARKLIAYNSTEAVIRMRNVLKEYNELLNHSCISLYSNGPDPIEANNNTVKRIFNNGSWTEGGRFYGGWWQNIKRNARHDILINGSSTIELDYKAMHPFMLYQKEGRSLDFDPYTLSEYDNHPDKKRLRNLIKDMLLIWINASSEIVAHKALLKMIRDDKANGERRYPDDIPPFDELKGRIKALNLPIEHCFFSGEGVRLQYIDSCIAERVIKAFCRQNKVVLSLHDGFRCEAANEGLLRQLMEDGYKTVMKTSHCPVIELKVR